MKIFNIIRIIPVIALMACHSTKQNTQQVPALKSKIDNFAANASCNDARVDEMEFQGNHVYVFNPGTCGADMTTEVTDNLGTPLGNLGGFTGNTKINGADFSSAKLISTVWKKGR